MLLTQERDLLAKAVVAWRPSPCVAISDRLAIGFVPRSAKQTPVGCRRLSASRPRASSSGLGVHTQTEALCGFDQAIAEESVIPLSREDGLAVIPAQDNVLRLAGNEVAG